MTKREKVKKFVKEHKKDIIIYSAFGVFAGIGMGHTIECVRNNIRANKIKKNTIVHDIPNLTIQDFGKVGKIIMSYYEGELAKDTPVNYWEIDIPKNK